MYASVNTASYSAIMDIMPMAALLVDGNARVHYANACADQLFINHPALHFRNDCLYFKHALQKRLVELLTNAVDSVTGMAADGGTPAFNALILSSREPHSDLEVQVQAIGAFESVFGMELPKPLALVCIKEVNPQSPLNREILQSLFGLSQREIELATLLVQGKTLNEIAQLKHRSLNTLKTQLKSLFAKTGTSSQSQLVARLLSSLAAARL